MNNSDNITFDTLNIPNRFKHSKHFKAYDTVVSSFHELPWKNLSDDKVAVEMAGLTALQAIAFKNNNYGLLKAVESRGNRRPDYDGHVLSEIMNLSGDELAGGLGCNGGYGSGYEPHSMLAIEAAEKSGYDVSGLLALVGYSLSNNNLSIPFKDRLIVKKNDFSGNDNWDSFLAISSKYNKTLSSAVGSFVLGEELIVSKIFMNINKYLPNDSRFADLDTFFSRHYEIDFGDNNGHSDTTLLLLTQSNINPNIALSYATELLQNKYLLYSSVLNQEVSNKITFQNKEMPEKGLAYRDIVEKNNLVRDKRNKLISGSNDPVTVR